MKKDKSSSSSSSSNSSSSSIRGAQRLEGEQCRPHHNGEPGEAHQGLAVVVLASYSVVPDEVLDAVGLYGIGCGCKKTKKTSSSSSSSR